MERKSFIQLVGMVRPMTTATTRLATPMSTNSTGTLSPSVCSRPKKERADHHEGGVEHVDGGDDAGAMIGAGPGLHGGERRHDEQAAGDGQPGEIDGDMDRRGEAKKSPMPIGLAAWTQSRRGPAEIDARTSRSARRRSASAAARCGHPRARRPRPDPIATDTEKMVRKSVTTPAVPPMLICHERRQHRQDERADEPEPARHQGAPPQPRIGAQVFDQGDGRGEDVAVDHRDPARPRRCAG